MLGERAREILRFGAVGGVAGVFDVGGSNLLHYGLHVGPLTSKVASTLVSVVVAYLGNRLWAFRHRAQRPDGAPSIREAAVFFLLNGVALVIALACVAVTRYVLGQDGPIAYNLAANVVGLGLGTVFRYWSYRAWVFTGPRPAEGLPSAPGRRPRHARTDLARPLPNRPHAVPTRRQEALDR